MWPRPVNIMTSMMKGWPVNSPISLDIVCWPTLILSPADNNVLAWVGQFLSSKCSTNFILEKNSFQNESHSRFMQTAPYC